MTLIKCVACGPKFSVGMHCGFACFALPRPRPISGGG